MKDRLAPCRASRLGANRGDGVHQLCLASDCHSVVVAQQCHEERAHYHSVRHVVQILCEAGSPVLTPLGGSIRLMYQTFHSSKEMSIRLRDRFRAPTRSEIEATFLM